MAVTLDDVDHRLVYGVVDEFEKFLRLMFDRAEITYEAYSDASALLNAVKLVVGPPPGEEES